MKSLLQSQLWAKFKVAQGWRAHRFGKGRVLVLERLVGRLPILYAPELTPEVLPLRGGEIRSLIRTAQLIVPRAVMLRLEWLVPDTEKEVALLKRLGFRKGAEVQPEHRQLIDLRRPLDEILRTMKPKTRYNLGLARHKQLTVVWGRDQQVEAFVGLYREAARRGRFTARSEAYFRALLSNLPMAEIVTISAQGRPIAAALISFFDGVASYLYGGLDYEARELMAPYLLHFAVMERAKLKHCRTYDLLAVGPRYPGLSRFKAGFGGEAVDYLGSFDYVWRPAVYRLLRLFERLRRGV